METYTPPRPVDVASMVRPVGENCICVNSCRVWLPTVAPPKAPRLLLFSR